MFISSMARKNSERKQRQRQRSKSTSSLRRSMESTSSQYKNNYNRSMSPPRSAVGKSSLKWCINGEGKPLLATRDIINTSNSAKTIRPTTSKSGLRSGTQSLNNSAIFHRDNEDVDGGGISSRTLPPPTTASTRPASCRPELLHVDKSPLPPRPKSSGKMFLNKPEHSSWYLDPLHRGRLSDNNAYPLYGSSIRQPSPDELRSSLQFGDGIVTPQAMIDDYDPVNERFSDLVLDGDSLDRDLDHLTRSRIVEEEAVARASSASPYELELCRLRKEKLRLEESYLLKKVCIGIFTRY